MPGKMKVLKDLAGKIFSTKTGLRVAGVTAAGAGGYGGFQAGKRTGAHRVASKLADVISETSQEAYEQGLEDSGKTAELSSGDAAFIDELEKIGFNVKAMGTAGLAKLRSGASYLKTQGGKDYLQSFKNLKSGGADVFQRAVGTAKAAVGKNKFSNQGVKEHGIGLLKRVGEVAGQSKAALATAGAAGAAGASAAVLSKKKQA